MIAGIAPVAWRAFTSGAVHRFAGQGPRFHLWSGLPAASRTAPLDGVGVVFGLGFVLSFGYWCTDFVLMQRAFTARTDAEARQVPLWAGFGKLFFSIIIVIAGLAAAKLIPQLGHAQRFRSGPSGAHDELLRTHDARSRPDSPHCQPDVRARS